MVGGAAAAIGHGFGGENEGDMACNSNSMAVATITAKSSCTATSLARVKASTIDEEGFRCGVCCCGGDRHGFGGRGEVESERVRGDRVKLRES